MYTSNSHSKEKAGDDAPSFWKERKILRRIITAGLSCLYAVSPAPRHLIARGRTLQKQTQQAPDVRRLHRLLQAVMEWLQAVQAWLRTRSPFLRPSTAARIQTLLGRVDRLAGEVQALRMNMDARFKNANAEIHGHIKVAHNDLREAVRGIHQRFDLMEKATEHDRAQVIEDALKLWALDPQVWSDVMTHISHGSLSAVTKELWNDRSLSQFWPYVSKDIGLPLDSPVQRCDLLALIKLTGTDAVQIEFLLVGEASVNMDGGRIAKVLRHVQDIQTYTPYSVLPCVCAHAYPLDVLAHAQANNVVTVQWKRSGRPDCHMSQPDLANRIQAMAPSP